MASAIVFVPGMCSVGDIVFKALVEQLERILPSTTLHVINLPSVDAIATHADLEPNGLQADINAVRTKLETLTKEGNSVLIVAHSYGGTPALYASEGLWEQQRLNEEGKVMKVALMSSSLPLPGGSVNGDREAWKQANGQIDDGAPQLEPHGKELFIVPTGLDQVWMNDLPESSTLRTSLRPSPLSTVLTSVPEADVTNWNIAYLATANLDIAMPEAFQKHLVDKARERGAKVSYETIKSSHFVQVSHAEEVASWVQKLAQAQ